MLTTDEVAARLGVSVRRVQQFAQQGRLQVLRYVRGSPVFTPDAVASFAAQPRRGGWPKGKPRKSAPDGSTAPPEGERPS